MTTNVMIGINDMDDVYITMPDEKYRKLVYELESTTRALKRARRTIKISQKNWVNAARRAIDLNDLSALKLRVSMDISTPVEAVLSNDKGDK